MKRETDQPRQRIPVPQTVTMPPTDYRPSKA